MPVRYWRKTPGIEEWRMANTDLRDPPRIAVHNQGLSRYPPVWSVTAMRSEWQSPQWLRYVANVLNDMAEKLERLQVSRPEVKLDNELWDGTEGVN